MSGGMRFTPEQLRALPLSMQEKIGLAIAAQLEKMDPAAEQKNKEMESSYDRRMAGTRGTEGTSVPF